MQSVKSNQKWLTIKELAKRWSVPNSVVLNMFHSGSLKGVKLTNKVLIVPITEVIRIESQAS